MSTFELVSQAHSYTPLACRPQQVDIAQKHDRALASVPWLSANGWLFKYAPHPDRAGYVFLATDLEMVLFESLTAPSIPSRLQSLASAHSQQGSSSQRTEGDVVKQAEQVLDKLEREVMVPGGRAWGAADVRVREHAFYDRVVEIRSGRFHWKFNMTELKSPQPLGVISKHLLGPLAARLLQMQDRKNTPCSRPIELISKLIAQPDFARSLLPPTAPHPANARPRADRTITQESNDSAARSERPSLVPETIPQEPLQEDAPDQANADEAEEDEEEYRSPEPSSPPQTRSSDLKPDDRVAGAEEDQDETASDGGSDHDDDAEMLATRTRSGGVSATKRGSTSASPPVRQPPSRAERTASPENSDSNKPAKRQKKEETTMQPEPSRSASPAVKPTPTPTQSSQKTKKEREREEEDLMQKRREEMKRKMGAGHGGRLGRRRAGG